MPSNKSRPTRGTAADPAKQAQSLLREMLADPRRGTPTWRHVAKAMAGDYEAPDAWRAIGGERDTVLDVVSMARQSFEAARAEARRPTAAAERKALERVCKLASDLQAAIKASPLPGDTAHVLTNVLTAHGRPDVELEIGWHSLREGGYLNGYPLAVCDVLEWAERTARDFLDRQPARAVIKRKKEPELAAFVRFLAWHFGCKFDRQMPTAIGHVASAIFPTLEPIVAKQVEGILKDRPGYMAPPRKQRPRPVT